jgi:diaminopimelate decarboxylase
MHEDQQLRFLDGEKVRVLAAVHGTPLYVYDESTMIRQYAALAELTVPFGLTIRYSLKANPSAGIIRVFDRLGANFDASSVWEAKRAVRAGVAPDKILLTAQLLDLDALEMAEHGMKICVGSLHQLEQYGRHFPGAPVSLRINPGHGSGLGPRLTSGGPSASFGIWYEQLGLARATAARYELRVERLHQHIGSSHDMDAWLALSEKLMTFVEEFPTVEVLNFGGGYMVHGFSDRPEIDHRAYFEKLANRILDHATRNGRRFHVELEPGTYLMASSGSLICKIGDVVETGASGYRFLKIDAGVTEILRPAFYGALHPVVVVADKHRAIAGHEKYLISGHCCIGGDQLTYEAGRADTFASVRLPSAQIGDYLVVERAGAYCASMSMKNFNSFPEAAEIMIDIEGNARVIRRRQTLEQIVANEIPM